MSRQTSLDVDNITLRTIQAKLSTNQTISAITVLTSDGVGGAYWSSLSSLPRFFSAFRFFCTPAATYSADASYNSLNFMSGEGIGYIESTRSFFSKGFYSISAPGQSTVSSYFQSTLDRTFSTLQFSTLGLVKLTTEPSTNTLNFQSIYPIFAANSTNLILSDSASTTTVKGYDAIVLSTSMDSFQIGLSISSFTSTGFNTLLISTQAYASSFYSSLLLSTFLPMESYITSTGILSTQASLANLAWFQSTIPLSNQTMSSINALSSVAVLTRQGTLFDPAAVSSPYAEISTFSSLLSKRMEADTLASTASIFGQAYFYTQTGERTQNLITTLNDIQSTVSTSLQLFGGWAKQSEFFSTFSSLGVLASSTYSTLNVTNGPLHSSFSTLAQSYLTPRNQRFQIHSTLRCSIFSPSPQIGAANGVGYDIRISTASVNFSSIIQFVDSTSKVFLEFTPNYSFLNLQKFVLRNSTISRNIYPAYTYLQYGGSHFVPNSDYLDQVQLNYSTKRTSASRLYSKPIRIEMSTGYLLANYTSSYVITHYHSSIVSMAVCSVTNPYGGIVVPYTTGILSNSNIVFSQSAFTNLMSPTNSVYISIYDAIR